MPAKFHLPAPTLPVTLFLIQAAVLVFLATGCLASRYGGLDYVRIRPTSPRCSRQSCSFVTSPPYLVARSRLGKTKSYDLLRPTSLFQKTQFARPTLRFPVRDTSVAYIVANMASQDNDPQNDSLAEEKIDISIEYCSACQWMLRSTWLASEILTTFAKEPRLHSISLIPKSPPLSEGGIFCISASIKSVDDTEIEKKTRSILWDRKIEGRFPEAKEVKQLIRDVVNPSKDLGHSDVKNPGTEKGNNQSINAKKGECIECKEQQEFEANTTSKTSRKEGETSGNPPGTEGTEETYPSIFYQNHRVTIEYSTGSSVAADENGIYRASWYANELLGLVYGRNAWWKKQQQRQSDEEEQKEDVPTSVDCVTLIPNRDETNLLKIILNDNIHIYDHNGSTDSLSSPFLDASELKARIRQTILEGSGEKRENDEDSAIGVEMMSEEEAEEARRFFGVF